MTINSKLDGQKVTVDLSEMRVIQKNLVYIIGIPLKYESENLLKGQEFFGQFGPIKKLVIKKRSISDATFSAYITYNFESDAMNCIVNVDESLLDGKVLKCTFGTTKYCTYFLKGMKCQNIECMYLHEIGKRENSFTKEEMLGGKGKFHNFKVLNKNRQFIGQRYEFDDMVSYLRKIRGKDDNFRIPDKLNFRLDSDN
ncbi:CCR4-NOT transcription complex subunit 4 [Dictyocoela muelleri]|nr:CCR4-NOT transcription complex subunit 4 [Dictyocoela muelleri]